jgi:hypothetical protein
VATTRRWRTARPGNISRPTTSVPLAARHPRNAPVPMLRIRCVIRSNTPACSVYSRATVLRESYALRPAPARAPAPRMGLAQRVSRAVTAYASIRGRTVSTATVAGRHVRAVPPRVVGGGVRTPWWTRRTAMVVARPAQPSMQPPHARVVSADGAVRSDLHIAKAAIPAARPISPRPAVRLRIASRRQDRPLATRPPARALAVRVPTRSGLACWSVAVSAVPRCRARAAAHAS